MKKRFLLILLMMTAPLGAVMPAPEGGDEPTPAQQKVAGLGYTGSQKAQFALTTVKSLARLLAGGQPYDLTGRNAAWLGNAVCALTHGANRILDGSSEGAFSYASKAAHANAALWQMVKLGEEFKLLRSIEKQLTDDKDGGFVDPEALDQKSVDLLKKHYYGAEEYVATHGNNWFEEDEEGLSTILKKWARFLLIVGEWGASLYSIHNNGQDKGFHSTTQIIQAGCDLALRYLFRDGTYKTDSVLGKVEMVTSALPHALDLGAALKVRYEIEQEKAEERRKKEEERRKREKAKNKWKERLTIFKNMDPDTPIREVYRQLGEEVKEEEEIRCNVCFDEEKRRRELCMYPCGHIFCRECDTNWRHMQHHDDCPTCRKHVRGRQVIYD